MEDIYFHIFTDDIEWPDTEDWAVQNEAKELISALLQHSPRDRLGTGGAQDVKEHLYFNGLDWNSLLRHKAEFVPQLEHEDDTSYFDSRMERYNHEEEDTDDTDDSPVFGMFSSCSPQYRKAHSSRVAVDQNTSLETIKITTSVVTTPDTPELPEVKAKLKATSIASPDREVPDVSRVERRKVTNILKIFNLLIPFNFRYLWISQKRLVLLNLHKQIVMIYLHRFKDEEKQDMVEIFFRDFLFPSRMSTACKSIQSF